MVLSPPANLRAALDPALLCYEGAVSVRKNDSTHRSLVASSSAGEMVYGGIIVFGVSFSPLIKVQFFPFSPFMWWCEYYDWDELSAPLDGWMDG